MKIPIEHINTPDVWRLTGTVKLRIYANQSFMSSGGQFIPQGTPGAPNTAYLEVTCTVLSNVLTIPGFEIDSTVDSLDNPWATYTAELVAGSRRVPFLANFAINTLQAGDPSTTWGEIILLKNALEPQSIPESLTRQIIAQIQLAVGDLNKASETNTGGTALTVDPIDPTFPVAVSANDPDWLALISPESEQWFNALENGLTGDGVTDDTAALQALINTISVSGKDATIFFPAGIYIIGGALQDVALSNSQIVLPKISKADGMRTLRFLGASPAAQSWPTDSGSILNSTLAAGNGSIIGVRCNWGGATTNALLEVQNAMTFLTFVTENMTVRAVANPTLSGVDHRFIHRPVMRHCRIDVEGITTGPGSITPDVFCAEPTTAASYGLLTPIGGVPSIAIYEDLTVMGYYNGMRWGELVTANNLLFGGLKLGIEFTAGGHPSYAGKLLFVTCKELMRATGHDPFVVNPSIDTNIVHIQQLDYENSSGLMPWSTTTDHVNDPNNFLRGDIKWQAGEGYSFVRTGAVHVKFSRLDKPWHSRFPYTAFIPGDIEAGGHTIDETYRGLANSVAWKLLTAKMTGVADPVGILAFINDQIANGLDKRLAQIAAVTDGAINSGMLQFSTMNAGNPVVRAWLDHLGNFNLPGLMPRGVGPDIASANTIAPTFGVHVVTGTGVIKTITVPPILAGSSVEIDLLPAGLWTYDNTDNISTNGAAVVGRTMKARWYPIQGKWSMSY